MPTTGDPSYNSLNYEAQGGASWVVGGELDLRDAGALKVGGVDVTKVLTLPGGTAFRIASGETALDGANPTPIVTGLTAISAVILTIKSTAAPGVGTSVVTYGTAGGTLNLYGWKVTSNIDSTLIASTGIETVGWIAVGT